MQNSDSGSLCLSPPQASPLYWKNRGVEDPDALGNPGLLESEGGLVLQKKAATASWPGRGGPVVVSRIDQITLYLSSKIGKAPDYREFFQAPRETLPEILKAFKLSAHRITGIGGLADSHGLTGEVVIPVGGPAYKVDVNGDVSRLTSEDKVIFLEVANYAPRRETVPGERNFAIDITEKNSWKQELTNLLPNKSRPYLVTMTAESFDLVEFQHPGEKSKYAKSIREYEPTAVGREFANLRGLEFVGFYGVDGAGFPGLHMHGIGKAGDRMVGGHLNEIIGKDIKVKIIPIRNVVTKTPTFLKTARFG